MTTKEKLMLAALKLFAQNGLDKTSTASIAKEAGVATGTLFIHFKTKTDLIETLFLEIEAEYYEQGKTALEAAENVLDFFISQMVLGGNYYLANFDKFIFMQRFSCSPYLSKMHNHPVRTANNYILELLDAEKRAGTIINKPNEYLLKLVIGAFFKLVEYAHLNKQKIKADDIKIILKMIRPEPKL